VISTSALHRAAKREGLRFDQVEKDYVILCLLSGISKELGPSAEWVFKGGTCLRHCYYEGYRFSEDIDFTCRPGPGGVDKARSLVIASLETMRKENGLDSMISRIKAPANESQVEIAVQYSRGGPRH
jgi:predicted nucleotidyltransferase component of viral defense system